MKITFIGGGNMAVALIGGLKKKGFSAAGIQVVEPNAEARERLTDSFGVRCAPAVDTAALNCEAIVLAVKPQQMREAVLPLKPLAASTVVVTIAAGIRIADLSRWLGGHAAIVRAMPNTPALIGRGIAGLFARPAVTAEERAGAESLFAPTGTTLWVAQESDLDAVTALSGSGPAYVFYFVEAMMQAAAEMGLTAAQGRQLALATFDGATALAAASKESPETLRAQVTSKGGTTHAAITALEEADVKAAFVRALHAARERARELGDEFGSV